MKQTDLGLNLATKRMHKREFLGQMERVVPWSALVELVRRMRPKASRAARPAQ